MNNKNLSEQLFKASFKPQETSTLTRRVMAFSQTEQGQWYRRINRVEWSLRGINPIEIDSVLARISINQNRRSHSHWLDTIIGYNPGNWIYEFSIQAANWQKKATEIENEESIDCHISQEKAGLANQYWLNACHLYSLASYPHFKGDQLAEQAALLAYRAYKEALGYADFAFNEVTFQVDNHDLSGILHLPQLSDEPYPLVIVCGGLDNLQSDYYYLFDHYLRPAGIAMLTLDLPSVGNSQRWLLTQDSCYLHKKVIEQLGQLAWIDRDKVALFGFKFGAHIATRLAYLMPNKIQAIACFAPIVHQIFTQSKLQASMPVMYRDMIANCLGLSDCCNEQLVAELACLSLKNQGLLGKCCPVPALSIYLDNDPMSDVNESRLITGSSMASKLIKISSSPLKHNTDKALKQMVDWVKARLI